MQYDKLGNIKQRSEIGDYTYSGVQAGPHAVTQANGLTYQYDANHSRYLKTNSDGVETFYFDKTYERVKDTTTGEVQHKHFVYADGKLSALNTQTRDTEDKLKDTQVRYLHYDALQSVDMITDGYGVVVERRSYNVWGKQRKVIWQEDSTTSVQLKTITNRGYTGHEEIEEVGLIHMNGRVYDQELGRFISPDPIIQNPLLTASFNRYSYAVNNPLKYIVPTGYTFGETCDVETGPNNSPNGGKMILQLTTAVIMALQIRGDVTIITMTQLCLFRVMKTLHIWDWMKITFQLSASLHHNPMKILVTLT